MCHVSLFWGQISLCVAVLKITNTPAAPDMEVQASERTHGRAYTYEEAITGGSTRVWSVVDPFWA